MGFREAQRKVIDDFRRNQNGKCEDGHGCPPLQDDMQRWPIQADGQVYHPTAWGAKQHIAYKYYLKSVFGFTTFTGSTLVTNRVTLNPIEVPCTMTFDAIVAFWHNVCAGNYRTGIYEDNGLTPAGGNLIVESASAAKAGTFRKQEFTIADTQLTAGLYWLAGAGDENTTTSYIDHWGIGGSLLMYRYALGVYGPLTDPCPAVTSENHCHVLWLRVKSIP